MSLTTAAARLLRSRRLMRAPIQVYRAGLGFLFGERMLMLEHIGRTSGAVRRVVLEVIDHPDRHTYVVVSGFGMRAQWFRNVTAHPDVRVAVGRLRWPVPATARLLARAEADAALGRYVSRHPRAWAALKAVVDETAGTGAGDDAGRLPVVALRLTAPRIDPSGH